MVVNCHLNRIKNSQETSKAYSCGLVLKALSGRSNWEDWPWVWAVLLHILGNLCNKRRKRGRAKSQRPSILSSASCPPLCEEPPLPHDPTILCLSAWTSSQRNHLKLLCKKKPVSPKMLVWSILSRQLQRRKLVSETWTASLFWTWINNE